jgi:hypothetical protein
VIVVAVRNLETLPILKLTMKMILFACVITLVMTTGCFFPGPGRGWHGHRADNNVATPAVVVAAPEVIVAPPEVAVTTTNVIAPASPVVVPITAVIAP